MKPKIKQIINEAEFDENDEDACLFYLSYDEDMRQIMLTVKSNVPMTPELYFEALADFLNNIESNPGNLFVENVDLGEHLH